MDVLQSGGEAAAIDQLHRAGPAHKMGPLKTCDLVGLDVMLALRSLHEQTGDAAFAPPEVFVRMVGEETGRQERRGFYAYGR